MDKILRFPEVVALVGLSKASLYRMISAGQFVPQVRLGERSVGFRASEVAAWIESRKAA